MISRMGFIGGLAPSAACDVPTSEIRVECVRMAVLNTVRAKLTTLVGLSALATLAALPLLNWVMSRQLIDVVDDRVPDAVRGFDLELGDDVRDLQAATRSLAD